jgi:hypothetical protein
MHALQRLRSELAGYVSAAEDLFSAMDACVLRPPSPQVDGRDGDESKGCRGSEASRGDEEWRTHSNERTHSKEKTHSNERTHSNEGTHSHGDGEERQRRSSEADGARQAPTRGGESKDNQRTHSHERTHSTKRTQAAAKRGECKSAECKAVVHLRMSSLRSSLRSSSSSSSPTHSRGGVGAGDIVEVQIWDKKERLLGGPVVVAACDCVEVQGCRG